MTFFEKIDDGYRVHGFVGYLVFLTVKNPRQLFGMLYFAVPGWFIGMLLGFALPGKVNTNKLIWNVGALLLIVTICMGGSILINWTLWKRMIGNGTYKPVYDRKLKG